MTKEPQYSIKIEYDDFLTRFDLDSVIQIIDRIIDGDDPSGFVDFEYEFDYFYRRRFPINSYVGITSVRRGSLILSVLISSTVSGYVSKRFFPQFREGRLSGEIKRTARLSDEALGSALEKINDFFERFVPLQKQRGGNITSVKMSKKPKRPSKSEKEK